MTGVPGTGPGRGVPWWRWVFILTRRHEPGRPADDHRPGRVIKVVGR